MIKEKDMKNLKVGHILLDGQDEDILIIDDVTKPEKQDGYYNLTLIKVPNGKVFNITTKWLPFADFADSQLSKNN